MKPSQNTDLQLRKKIGQMIMVGFKGVEPTEPEVIELENQVRQGLVGGGHFLCL